jgi:hypothetical protein
MRKKYYKQIINSLDVKLDDAIQANERLRRRIKELESSNEQLRKDLAEMSIEMLKRQIIDEHNEQKKVQENTK